MTIRTVDTEFFHADRQTGRQADMTKPVVAFRKFSKAPNSR